MKISLFILDDIAKYNSAVEDYTNYARSICPEINIQFQYNNLSPHLPKGYDGYVLHLSQTTEEEIIELRESQPWSKIFGISGAISEPHPANKLVYHTFNPFYPSCLDWVIEETQKKKQRFEE